MEQHIRSGDCIDKQTKLIKQTTNGVKSRLPKEPREKLSDKTKENKNESTQEQDKGKDR